VWITYFNPHFCISEMPTIYVGSLNTLFIFQSTLRSFGSALTSPSAWYSMG